MKTIHSTSLLPIAMMLAAAFCLAGCDDGGDKGPAAPAAAKTVKAPVLSITSATQPIYYEATGTVRPKTAATLSAKVMGEIKEVLVDEGDIVRKGQTLLRIEGGQVTAGLAQAQAGLREARQAEQAALSGLESAKAAAGLAAATYQRYQKLLASQSVSRQEFDEVNAKHLQAQAALSQAQFMLDAARERSNQASAAVASAKSVVADTVLTSPYDGVITERLVNAGDMASPGLPLLNIEEEGMMEVHLLLPETHIGRVALNASVAVSFPSQTASQAVTGLITTIDPSADPATRSFRIKVTLPQTPGIRAGMFARVRVPVGEAGMVLIPAASVVRQGQLTAVFLVGEAHIARFRLIRLGRAFGDQVEVVSGLKYGDRIVEAPDGDMTDGVKVEAI